MANSELRAVKSRKEQTGESVPFACPSCYECRLLISGPMIGTCLYGGPFSAPLKGADMKDKDNKIDPK